MFHAEKGSTLEDTKYRIGIPIMESDTRSFFLHKRSGSSFFVVCETPIKYFTIRSRILDDMSHNEKLPLHLASSSYQTFQ